MRLAPDPIQPSASAPALHGCVGSFSLLGTTVHMHFTIVLLGVCGALIAIAERHSPLVGLAFAVALISSLLAHEAAHAGMARVFGIRTNHVVLLPFGGLARMAREPSPRQELAIASAGPLANLFVGVSLAGWLALHGRLETPSGLLDGSHVNVVGTLSTTNLALFLINLLPARPFDGARILRTAAAMMYPKADVEQFVSATAQAAAMGLATYALMRGRFALAVFALFVFWNALRERVVRYQQQLIKGLFVRDAMQSEFFSVPHSARLHQVSELTLVAGQPVVPVVCGRTVLGVVDHASVRAAIAAHGTDAYAAVATDRNVAHVAPDDALELVMGGMAAHAGCLLVMEGDKLRGLLTRESVANAVARRVATSRQSEVDRAVGPASH